MANIFDLFKKIEKTAPTVQGPVTHLVVGLGNPGAQYLNTRHNAGFLSLDAIAEKLGVRIEDVIVLTEDGCRDLTQAPKELLVL